MDLRPKNLSDFIGNEKIKERIRIQIVAAKKMGTSLPHMLLQGMYGCGKSTLAYIIANEMGSDITVINAACIEHYKDILEVILNVNQHDIVFIDEVHALSTQFEESLYLVMEDFKINLPREFDLMFSLKGIGDIKKFEPKDIPTFTLIGGTTNIGIISGPFFTRFKSNYYLQKYSIDDLAKIAETNAKKLSLSLSHEMALEIAKRSKGVPRILNSRLEWINEYRVGKNISTVTLQTVLDAIDSRPIG